MKDVLVIVPSYNESKNIRTVEKDLKTNFPEADILFINDKSKDDTLEIIKSFDDVKYLNLPINLGYFFAIQSGLKYAAQNGYKHVVQFDGDGQHLAKEAKYLYDQALKDDADIIIGSRYLKDTGYKNSFLRNIGTKIIGGLFKTLTGQKISDPTSGLQVLNHKAADYLSQIYNYPETADANLLMELIYNKFKLKEVSVQMLNRETGESMHDGLIGPAKYMSKSVYYMFLVFLNNLFKKDNG